MTQSTWGGLYGSCGALSPLPTAVQKLGFRPGDNYLSTLNSTLNRESKYSSPAPASSPPHPHTLNGTRTEECTASRGIAHASWLHHSWDMNSSTLEPSVAPTYPAYWVLSGPPEARVMYTTSWRAGEGEQTSVKQIARCVRLQGLKACQAQSRALCGRANAQATGRIFPVGFPGCRWDRQQQRAAAQERSATRQWAATQRCSSVHECSGAAVQRAHTCVTR